MLCAGQQLQQFGTVLPRELLAVTYSAARCLLDDVDERPSFGTRVLGNSIALSRKTHPALSLTQCAHAQVSDCANGSLGAALSTTMVRLCQRRAPRSLGGYLQLSFRHRL